MSIDTRSVELVRSLPIDQGFLRRIIIELTSIGSSDVGFRTTGTVEDAAVATFVAAEMHAMGLCDVAVEEVEVDAWRFRSATVCAAPRTGEALGIDAVSFGGIPATPAGGITARLVDVGDARRRRLDRLELAGAIALLDWRSHSVSPSAIVLELAHRGVAGLIVNCPSKGAWYQTPDAVGAFDSGWPAGAPPMVLISKENAARLRLAPRDAPVTMTLEVELTTRASGSNVVGYLEGTLPGPMIVGAHHDAWFRGAFDNTSGVAAMLAMAKALCDAGHRPQHSVCFTSRTGEEYGITDCAYDWCIGAWRQVETTHPNWATDAPFHLCVEASGHHSLRSVIEAPVELGRWARQVGHAAEREGWTPTGWRVAPPVAGTEQWPLLVSGVPGVACYAWEKSFGKTDYHTQFDTIDLIDFAHLSAQTRMYLLALLEADRDPDVIIDHPARARQLAKIAAQTQHSPLLRAAAQHSHARGRADFTRVGRSVFSLDAHAELCYPHEQAHRDVCAIAEALSALDNGDLQLAARRLRRVGSHHLFPYLGEVAFRAHAERNLPEAVSRSWASRSHLTASCQLWPELASILGEPGARRYGPWVRASLLRAQQRTQRQLVRRLDAMTRSVTTSRTNS